MARRHGNLILLVCQDFLSTINTKHDSRIVSLKPRFTSSTSSSKLSNCFWKVSGQNTIREAAINEGWKQQGQLGYLLVVMLSGLQRWDSSQIKRPAVNNIGGSFFVSRHRNVLGPVFRELWFRDGHVNSDWITRNDLFTDWYIMTLTVVISIRLQNGIIYRQ